MANLYQYTNYRTFLEDHFKEVQEKNPRFSYRAFCRVAGFSSPNFVRMIILGQRNLSGKGIFKVATGLGLKRRETEFFESLVYFTQAESHEERVKHYEEMCFFKAFQEVKRIDHQSYRYFSKWYYPAIREMTLVEGFREDPRWIASHLNGTVSEDEVRDALKLLLELGFVAKDKQHRLRAVDKNITTSNVVASLSLINFHREMMAQAASSLERTPHEFRDISSITVGINMKDFLQTKTKLQELRQELNLSLSRCDNPEAVYQINFQIFNLTAIPKKWQSQA